MAGESRVTRRCTYRCDVPGCTAENSFTLRFGDGPRTSWLPDGWERYQGKYFCQDHAHLPEELRQYAARRRVYQCGRGCLWREIHARGINFRERVSPEVQQELAATTEQALTGVYNWLLDFRKFSEEDVARWNRDYLTGPPEPAPWPTVPEPEPELEPEETPQQQARRKMMWSQLHLLQVAREWYASSNLGGNPEGMVIAAAAAYGEARAHYLSFDTK